MIDLSLHILDLVQNSLTAGADTVTVTLAENTSRGWALLIIRDNGQGIGEVSGDELLSPFYSTKKVRKFGLGLALVEQVSRQCGGSVRVKAFKDRGTVLVWKMEAGHWDMPPLGRLDLTALALIAANRQCRWRFNWSQGKEWRRLDSFNMDTSSFSTLKAQISAILGEGYHETG